MLLYEHTINIPDNVLLYTQHLDACGINWRQEAGTNLAIHLLRDLLCEVSLGADNDSGRRGFVRRNGHLPLFWGLQFLIKPDNKWICRYLKDKVGHVDCEGNLSIFVTPGPTMSSVHKIYNKNPDAASSFIKKLLETACGIQIRKVHEYYKVVRYPREFAMGINLPKGVMSNTFVHTSSTILSNESTTEDELVLDAIHAFNKARDDEIVTPTTKYDNLK
jgi:hypothetical protein